MSDASDDKEKTITIVVNGTRLDVPKEEILTYAEVATLAYPDFAQHPEMTYYRPESPQGRDLSAPA